LAAGFQDNSGNPEKIGLGDERQTFPIPIPIPFPIPIAALPRLVLVFTLLLKVVLVAIPFLSGLTRSIREL
jgi:hypothetical protein